MKRLFTLMFFINILVLNLHAISEEFTVDVVLKNAIDSTYMKEKAIFQNYSDTLFIVPKERSEMYTGLYIYLKNDTKIVNYSKLKILVDYGNSNEKIAENIKDITIFQNNQKLEILNIISFIVNPDKGYPCSTITGVEKEWIFTIPTCVFDKLNKTPLEYLNTMCFSGNKSDKDSGFYHIYDFITPNVLQVVCKHYVKKVIN
ncbi:hypothetical protein H0A43_00190 [Arcobacter lanthieri]|uniref:hypothetical protein n=1 Tax=Aliarcobacter lanthieri TaxID=1355374 RepID=UPI00192317C1|nr:hypothetical protein [Aliarcobacter lanthieri]MBL3518891.1 hypothetical protein [Aliarcobacter lanthieri]